MKITRDNYKQYKYLDDYRNGALESFELAYLLTPSSSTTPDSKSSVDIEKIKQGFDKEFPINHYYCEDNWYSCPMAPEGCADDSVGTDCNCGAIKKHKKLWDFFLPYLQGHSVDVKKCTCHCQPLYPNPKVRKVRKNK